MISTFTPPLPPTLTHALSPKTLKLQPYGAKVIGSSYLIYCRGGALEPDSHSPGLRGLRAEGSCSLKLCFVYSRVACGKSNYPTLKEKINFVEVVWRKEGGCVALRDGGRGFNKKGRDWGSSFPWFLIQYHRWPV